MKKKNEDKNEDNNTMVKVMNYVLLHSELLCLYMVEHSLL